MYTLRKITNRSHYDYKFISILLRVFEKLNIYIYIPNASARGRCETISLFFSRF